MKTRIIAIIGVITASLFLGSIFIQKTSGDEKPLEKAESYHAKSNEENDGELYEPFFTEEERKELKSIFQEIIQLEEKGDREASEEYWAEFESVVSDLTGELASDEEQDDEFNEERTYQVKNGKIDFEKDEQHQQIWSYVTKIVPEKIMSRITSFEVGTDGKDEMLAYVVPNDDTNQTWLLGVDKKDAFDSKGKLVIKDIQDTIIHELGHIMTLNDTQMQDVEEDTKTYTTDEGTLKKDAYLNQFYETFWKDIHEEWKKAMEAESDEAMNQFYEKHKSKFISEYAMTNPEEDIAESFMRFIVDEKPKGDTMAEEKIRFFYQFDELVKLRKEMREKL
ncbi:putative zinc-binding metallopeptidase [Bacillus sp. FJAT-47783]|uniref:putative zinc-binding metallopeptidase n=1 Tax=Bacillus sp. FJAT-47783 TaxID=2922712 RepID=UPI001FADD82D|nr:putative zinc-binding metallopeptidase [Bacillus sp. FJAT-47783]